MAPKKKKKLSSRTTLAIVLTVSMVIIASSLASIQIEAFLSQTRADSLSVTPEIDKPLPKIPVETTLKCTPNEQFNMLTEIVDEFPCDENNEGIKSIQEMTPQIKDTKESRFQSFLEQIGLASIDQFGVATVVTLKDIANNTKTFNSILPVILLSVGITGDDPFLLDEAEIEFFGVLKDTGSSSLNLDGTVSFIIDEQVIDTKRLFTSETVRDVNNIPLNIVDNIPPPFGDKPFIYTYDFDETEFIDGSTHFLRVVITQLTGTYVVGGETKFIDWNGTFLAYELEFIIDETMKVIIDENGDAIQVFKNDSRLLVCGTPEIDKTSTVGGREQFVCKQTFDKVGILEDVKVFENIGGNVAGKLIGEVKKTDNVECKEITGLSRSDDYIFQVGNQQFPVSTPVTQQDYNVKFSQGNGKALIRSINGGEFSSGTFVGWECVKVENWLVGTSNFGYSFDSRNP